MGFRRKSIIVCFIACLILNVFLCLWVYLIAESQLEATVIIQHETHVAKSWGFGFIKESCQLYHVPRYNDQSEQRIMENHTEMEFFEPGEGTCSIQLAAEMHHVDIQMEKEWDKIHTGYPQYVYTVSGWKQVIDIPSYKVKGHDRPLQVIIVPHSHQDPGWLHTSDSYFTTYTRETLSLAVSKLKSHPHWKFIWAEVLFLARWWKQASSKEKDNLKTLVNNGQFEIVTGGWVVSDEATEHYESMLGQLIEGHQWLLKTLGKVPTNAWSIDEFGYSPTMPYMLKRSGLENIVIQRVHYSVKKHLASSLNLEFYWKQVWDGKNKTDIFTHMMPFLSYNIPSSCGPDLFICCQFDFSRKKCTLGQKKIPLATVTKENVASLSRKLWEQFQKKAQLFRSNVLLVPHGDDFRYSDSSEWDNQLGNMEKLMTYMNEAKTMHIIVKFGTLSDYFDALKNDKQHISEDLRRFPSLSGDFFPYNDRDDQYWTGYFTSRPFLKHIARILQSRLRLAEILYSLSLVEALRTRSNWFSFLENKYENLVSDRQALALFQHHDAITGTSKASVVKNYASILHTALKDINSLLAAVITFFMLKSSSQTAGESLMMLTELSLFPNKPPEKIVNDVTDNKIVVVSNPLTVHRNDVVSVKVSNPYLRVIESISGKGVLYQINPVFNRKKDWEPNLYEVLFAVSLAPLSLKTYILMPVVEKTQDVFSKVLMINKELIDVNSIFSISVAGAEVTETEIHNNYLKASFSTCTGLLKYVQRKADKSNVNVQMKFVTYGTGSWKNPYKDKSGAYIFLPDGPAKETNLLYPSMFVVSGSVSSSVYTVLQGVVQKVTLHNVEGPLSSAVLVDNDVDIGSSTWDNKELVMKLETDINNSDGTFCVDLNGFQMHRKKRRSKMKIQGNFHPLTSSAFVEDLARGERLTLLAGEAHGVASLDVGWLEVVLDRRLMQDDWRGLGEGVKDNEATPSRFIIVIENMTSSRHSDIAACFLSMLSNILSQYLNNPIISFVPVSSLVKHIAPMRSFMNFQLPCALQLLNLRSFQPSKNSFVTALLIVHHTGLDCSFQELPENKNSCKSVEKLNLAMFDGVKIVSATEMNLSGVHKKKAASLNEETIPPMEIQTYKVILK